MMNQDITITDKLFLDIRELDPEAWTRTDKYVDRTDPRHRAPATTHHI